MKVFARARHFHVLHGICKDAISMSTKPFRLAYRSHELPALLGVGRQTYYSWLDQDSPQHDPSFPRPIQLGGLGARAKGHLAIEIDE